MRRVTAPCPRRSDRSLTVEAEHAPATTPSSFQPPRAMPDGPVGQAATRGAGSTQPGPWGHVPSEHGKHSTGEETVDPGRGDSVDVIAGACSKLNT
jgi:hypothetical protein